MRIRPLTGQVLVELDPRPEKDGSIFLPDVPVKSTPDDPFRRKQSVTGIVKEMGSWPKAKNGFMMLPPFGIGAHVVLNEYTGTKLQWDVSGRLRLVKTSDVLAVLT